MYSPKISEALIPRLYFVAKQNRMHMTTLVNTILQTALSGIESEKNSDLFLIPKSVIVLQTIFSQNNFNKLN